MKKAKKILSVLLVFTCIFTVTACGAVMKDSESGASGGSGYRNVMAAQVVAESDGGWGDMPESAVLSDMEADFPQQAEALPDQPIRRIIRNAKMDLESKNPSELYRILVTYCELIGGYVFSSEVNNFDNISRVSATLKVPPEKLDDFMTYAGDNGRVIVSRIDSNDVTSEFYDIATRLETKRRSLDAYYEMLEKALTVNDVLTFQRIIDGIIEEIEAFEGRLRVLRSLTDMATVNITIIQEKEPEPEIERREIDWSSLSIGDMGYFIRNGFIAVVSVITTIVQWIIIALAVTSPLWLPAGALVVILIKLSKRKKK